MSAHAISNSSSAFASISACAYVSIRQHTSAYVSIRQHTSAHVSIRPCVSIRHSVYWYSVYLRASLLSLLARIAACARMYISGFTSPKSTNTDAEARTKVQ
jgi:hypothetical protein